MPFFTKTFRFGARPEFDFRLARSLKIRPLSERKLNSGLATKLNVFVKSAINSFFSDEKYKKQLLVTLYPKLIPSGITAGTFLTSPGTLCRRVCVLIFFPIKIKC